MIVTSVSTCGLQRQSNKGKLSSNEVVKSPRLRIEHMNSHDKRIQTRTFGATTQYAFVMDCEATTQTKAIQPRL